MSSNIVINYNDYVLRQSDVDILKSNGWLTDTIIGFYLQYLEKEIYPEQQFLFVSPEVTQCIKSIQKSEIKIFLDPLSPNKYSLIFFPLNNNEDINTAGGSHWSLLVYDRCNQIFYHLDSSRNTNCLEADKLTSKLNYYFNKNSQFKLDELPCLQQNNGYDCGIHLLCNVEHIANCWLKHKTLANITSINKEDVKTKRNNILSIIFSKK